MAGQLMHQELSSGGIYDKVKECYKQVNEMTEFKPQIALVLGSGLGDYAEKIKIETVIDYHEIKGFPVSTVQGHKGRFVLGYVEDIPVMIMKDEFTIMKDIP